MHFYLTCSVMFLSITSYNYKESFSVYSDSVGGCRVSLLLIICVLVAHSNFLSTGAYDLFYQETTTLVRV